MYPLGLSLCGSQDYDVFFFVVVVVMPMVFGGYIHTYHTIYQLLACRSCAQGSKCKECTHPHPSGMRLLLLALLGLWVCV